MRINGSRVDDIKKEREEYLAKYEKDQAEYDKQDDAYLIDLEHVMAVAEDTLRQVFKGKDRLYPEFDIRQSWTRGRDHGLRITINVNNGSLKEREGQALTWEYRANLNYDGVIERQTNSWSGLDATTPDQIEELKQAVAVMEELNSLDWKSIVDVDLPKWDAYHTLDNPEYTKNRKEEEFRGRIRDAQLEEVVGDAHKWIVIDDWLTPKDSRDYRWRGQYAVRILRETPSQYEVEAVWVGRNSSDEDIVKMIESKLGSPYTQRYRLRKTSVQPCTDENGELAIFDI